MRLGPEQQAREKIDKAKDAIDFYQHEYAWFQLQWSRR